MASVPSPAVHNVALSPKDGVLCLQVWDATDSNWVIWIISAKCPVGSEAGAAPVFRRGEAGVHALIVQMNAPDYAPIALSAEELLDLPKTELLAVNELTGLDSYEFDSDPETGEAGLDAPPT